MDLSELSRKYELKEKKIDGIYGSYSFSILMALLFRYLYIVHASLLIFWAIQKSGPSFLLYFYLLLFVIAIEGCYVVYVRKGRESKYYSLCIHLYIIACTPSIWVLHFKRQPFLYKKLLREWQIAQNQTLIDDFNGIINFNNRDDEIFRYNETIFLALIVLSRWFLPKDDLNREDSYVLIISNLSMAADCHDIFFIADDLKALKRREYFQSFLLFCWTFSLPLFAVNTSTESYSGKKFRQNSKRHVEKFFGNFYWKYITSMVLMDGPYFLVRIIGVIDFEIIDYQNIYFIFKNGIQMIIQIYSILGKIFFPEGSDLYEQNIDRKRELINDENL
jgi:hypothetical protein